MAFCICQVKPDTRKGGKPAVINSGATPAGQGKHPPGPAGSGDKARPAPPPKG